MAVKVPATTSYTYGSAVQFKDKAIHVGVVFEVIDFARGLVELITPRMSLSVFTTAQSVVAVN